MEFAVIFLEVAFLVGLSAICSGLNIALMSLSPNDLKRKAKLGNLYAKRVLPLRQNSHLSLASILFTNVAVISVSTLVLEHHFNGLIAGVVSTLLIVVFGEVLPQAWFARYALTFCGILAPLLKVMIIITWPVSKPLQLLLDKIIRPEDEHLHSRRELGIIINEHARPGASELDEDEVEIMQGALTLSEKRVRDIMTPIRRVYSLKPGTLLDDQKIDELKAAGWSRVPVLEANLQVCHGVILMKDLVDIDFDEAPVYVEDIPLHPCKNIGSMTALDTLFRKFIGARSHLMMVERNDRFIGIVTIEDLIEEILGHEIEDEFDEVRMA